MNQVINNIIEMHKNNKNVFSGAIIGSYAKEQYIDGESDIDLLFLVGNAFHEKMVSKEISNKYTIKKYYDVYSIETTDTVINISYHRIDEFKELIYKIIECRDIFSINKPWTVGGVCDDVLMEDIQKAIIFFDKNKTLTECQYRINNCDLKEWHKKMKEKLDLDIIEKKHTIMNFYKKRLYKLAYFGLMELGQLEHRLYYAERNQFYPGFKHISRINDSDFLAFDFLNAEECGKILSKYFEHFIDI